MDDLTKDQRRRNMQHIRSNDTSIEVKLRKALWHKGYRYRKNDSRLPGKPDIVLTKYKIAIFCDGEFFHGKDWEISTGLVRFLETESVMKMLTNSFCFRVGRLLGFGVRKFRIIQINA